jgi:hypothetical protein
VAAGSEVIVDNELALTANGEVSVEALALVPGLDDQGRGVSCLGDGLAGLRGDRRYGRHPGLSLLFGGIFPGWEGFGVGATMSFVRSLGEAFEGASHVSMMPASGWAS